VNSTTRKSKRINGNSFDIYAPVESNIRVFSYIMGTLAEINVTYTEIKNGMKEAKVDSTSDGYYFVRSGKVVQSLVKGNVPYFLFYFDPKRREDLELLPKTYDHDGSFLGYNNSMHIGSGIYRIEPLVMTPTIVEVFGKLFHSYPNEDNNACPETHTGSSVVDVGVSSKSASITIGKQNSRITIGSPSIGMRVSQTVFEL
jgi:hypothetical protein